DERGPGGAKHSPEARAGESVRAFDRTRAGARDSRGPADRAAWERPAEGGDGDHHRAGRVPAGFLRRAYRRHRVGDQGGLRGSDAHQQGSSGSVEVRIQSSRSPSDKQTQGAVMEISGLTRVVPAALDINTIPIEATVSNREVVQAVRAVNQSELLGDRNQLTFQQDPATHRVVVKLVNRDTGEVVSQIPSETVIGLAAELKKQSKT